MSMSKIQGVKGTRDLYPELLAPIRHIFDVWRRVSIRHGFEEYEGPTLETLELYKEKSGDELVGQLYQLTDSGGRALALRPEMTPTLARMVAAKINALPKPIKWFSIPTLFRGENVQRGRLREFYQWNIDVIGAPQMAADAECILVGVEALRELGLTENDFVVHISNRRLMAAMLGAAGIPADQHGLAYVLMDKSGKLPDVELGRRWDEAFKQTLPFEGLQRIMSAENPTLIAKTVQNSAELEEAIAQTLELLEILKNFGIGAYCQFNPRVVRGLAYYTGPVFEFYDRGEKERAICGGGRYDDLLGKLGKSKEPAVGFGMGDVVLALLLEEKKLLSGLQRNADVFVIDADPSQRVNVYAVAAALRRAGMSADFMYESAAVNRQLKLADKQGAAWVVLLGSEGVSPEHARVKKMSAGTTQDVAVQQLIMNPRDFIN
jgi:histidyl-tRNA synthetase